MHWELNLDARNKTVNSKGLISKYSEYIQVSKKNISGAAVPQTKTDTNHTSNALKCVQTSSAMSTHVRCFWDGLKKPLQNHHKQKWTKSIRWALMPLTPMVQLCRFRCVRVRFVLNISASAWRNKTVQGRASISQTTPTTTSTHLRPKATTPRPLHHGSQNDPPNWCQRPWYLTSRLWLRPDDREKHSEQSNFDAGKAIISMLWSQSAWT